MKTLKSYIKKKTKKQKTVVLLQEVESLVVDEEQGHARELYNLYKAIQLSHGKYTGNYEKNKGIRTCFKKLAKNIEKIIESGVEVNENLFITAHKATYGADLRPNHLISWCSFNIYTSYLTSLHSEVIEYSEDEAKKYYEEMILHISGVRGESIGKVKVLLEKFGIV